MTKKELRVLRGSRESVREQACQGTSAPKEKKAKSDREKLVVCNQQIMRKRRVPESA